MRISRRSLLRSAVVTLALPLAGLSDTSAVAQKKAPKGAKVLLLTGGQRQHHGYRDQALYLSNALEDTGRYEVTINEDAAILETPAMAKYDLIIVNADRRDPEFKFTESQQEALLDWVKAGPRLCLDPRRRQRRARLAARLARDARRRLLARRPARQQDQEGHIRRQDRRHPAARSPGAWPTSS